MSGYCQLGKESGRTPMFPTKQAIITQARVLVRVLHAKLRKVHYIETTRVLYPPDFDDFQENTLDPVVDRLAAVISDLYSQKAGEVDWAKWMVRAAILHKCSTRDWDRLLRSNIGRDPKNAMKLLFQVESTEG